MNHSAAVVQWSAHESQTHFATDVHVADLPPNVPWKVAQYLAHVPLLGARSVLCKIVLQGCGDGGQDPLHLQQVVPFRVRRHGRRHAAYEEVHPKQIAEFDARGRAEIVSDMKPIQVTRERVLSNRPEELLERHGVQMQVLDSPDRNRMLEFAQTAAVNWASRSTTSTSGLMHFIR